MALPLVLAYGYVAVYGRGTNTGDQNFPAAAGWKFGEITDQAPDLSGLIGNSVMFKESEVRCVISYQNYPYTITEEAKLVLTENPPT
jgi:hypothetical protein